MTDKKLDHERMEQWRKNILPNKSAEAMKSLSASSGSSLLWWCPECRQDVEPDMVTYEETHDARYGGCGGDVLYITKKNH